MDTDTGTDNQVDSDTGIDTNPGDGYVRGNPPVPSSGCGKSPVELQNGTHYMNSAGIDREFISQF